MPSPRISNRRGFRIGGAMITAAFQTILAIAAIGIPIWIVACGTSASAQTFTANFSTPVDPPLVKDKFGVYQTPLDSQATIQNASPFLTEAQIRDMRYEIGIGKSNALAYTQVGGTSASPTYSFASIDALISSWTSVKTFPLIAFTYCPTPLQTDGNFQDVPSNLSTWGSINAAYASHFRNSDGRPGVWFEQWNEPDLSIGSKVFFNGDQADYGNVYANGSSGVRSGDSDARVGGPAVAYDTTYLTSSGMLSDPLDFVSIHSYANYSSQLSNLRGAVGSSRPSLPLLITEYASYTSFGDSSPNSLHQAAAAFFNDVSGLITITDNPKVYWAQWVDDNTGGGVGILTEDLHRKAIYNALKIYQTMLPADQVSVSPSTSGGVGSMAGSDPDNAGMVIWNNNTSAVTVTANLNSLPFSGGTAQLYYIDQSHASYLDGAPENLAVTTQWTFGSNSTSWTGMIQPQSIAFIKAYDSTGKSLLSYNSIGSFVRSYYWYFNRPGSGTSYSDFDPSTSIARVGMGVNTYDVAEIGNVYNNPTNNLTITVVEKSGPFSTNDVNSLFGLRFDFQNTSGNYDHSVLYTNGLYNSGRGSTLPWGEGTAVPDNVITESGMNTGTPFEISLSSIAPSDWNGTRVIITPIIQNAGAGSRATIAITPTGGGSATGLPYHDAFAGGSAPGWSTYNGTWSVSAGSYVNSAVDTGGDKAVAGSSSWNTYTLQGDVKITSGSGDAGLLVYVNNPAAGTDSLDGYYFGVSPSGTLELGREAYGWTLLQSVSMAVSLNTWYHLVVQGVGCTLTVSAQPVGSTTVTGFTYTDSGCAYTAGQVGVRSFNAAADWRDISVSSGGATTMPYYAPFASSASGWTNYAGTWSLGSEVYSNSAVDTQGDKSIGGPTGGNFTLTGDLELTTSGGDAGFLLRATDPAVGTDSVDAYYLGVNSAGNLVIGKENYGWTQLTTTPIGFSANSWYHLTGEVVGCLVTLTAQPATSTITTSVTVNDCSFSSGQVGLRSFDTSAGWRYVSVTPR